MVDHIKKKALGEYYLFPVYSEEEAREKGLTWVYWKDAQGGDWAISDDGFVSVCLKRKTYTNANKSTADVVYMAHGRLWANKNAVFNYLEFKKHGNFNSHKPQAFIDKHIRWGRVKNTIRAYVDMFLAYQPIDWKKLADIYLPNKSYDYTVRTTKILFNSRKVKEEVRRQVAEALEQQGVNESRTAEMFLEAYDLAESNNEPGNMIRVAENFGKMLGMYDGDTEANGEVAANAHVLDGVFDEVAKLTGRRAALPTAKKEKVSSDGE